MGLDWSLNEIYNSFESDEFKGDIKKFDVLSEEITLLVNTMVENKVEVQTNLEKFLEKYEEINLLVGRLHSFAHLTVSVDSKNNNGRKYSDIINMKWSGLTAPLTKFYKWLSSIEGIQEIINGSDKLSKYEFYLNEIIDQSKYTLSEKEEEIIAKMKNTGSDAWLNYKNLLISTHKVNINIDNKEESLPLTMVLNMAYDKDKKVRKKAYEAEINSYKKIEDGVASALNGIKGEVLTVSKMKGYTSPLEMTLKSSRMNEKILNSMLEAIEESLPIFRKYLRRKAELLGYKEGLPFFEMYAPVIEKEMNFTYEEGKAIVEKNFRKFSDSLADFAIKAFDNNWIDVMPKEGKVGGAFCAGIGAINESRILLNYGNSFSDVVTMAHELGHGFHGQCLKDESILNRDYPMTLAETASNFCEIIVKKGAINSANKEEAFAILENEISDCTQVIVDIYSRYLFESEVFRRRTESSLSVEEIKEAMLNAQKKAYGDGLDENYLHPYMWTWKPHYYYAGANFYNFPYAFGNLFAKGLYAEYKKRGSSFCTEYEELLSVTGKKDVNEVTRIMNIDVEDIEFWRGSIAMIKEDIESFMKLSYKI